MKLFALNLHEDWIKPIEVMGAIRKLEDGLHPLFIVCLECGSVVLPSVYNAMSLEDIQDRIDVKLLCDCEGEHKTDHFTQRFLRRL